MMTKKTNFFIVGAPKCGTTSLCRYLKQHPDIFIPDLKEPSYFSHDLRPSRTGSPMALGDYLNLFKGINSKAIGEGSTQYLYSKIAAQEIYNFNPDAKIIIMLRNPADFLYSYHNQLLLGLVEDIQDFKLALEAEPERKAGNRIPKECTGETTLYYSEVAKFAEQVERYYDLFGQNRVQIIIFEDFKTDTAQVYRSTLDFLEVDPEFVPEFKVHNPRQKVRNQSFYRAYMNFKWTTFKIGRLLKPLPFYAFLKKIAVNVMHSAYLNNLLRKKESSAIEPELKEQLIVKFTPEVIKLSKIINRDLTSWTIHNG